MAVKPYELKKIKNAKVPNEYDYSKDTIYFSFIGLNLSDAVKNAKYGKYLLTRILLTLPEAIIVPLFLYFIINTKLGLSSIIFYSVIFYIIDIIAGALIARAKAMINNTKTNIVDLLINSIADFHALSYILLILSLVALYNNYIAYSYLLILFGIVSYMTTMRFSMSSLFFKKRIPRSNSIDLSMQFIGENFTKVLLINLIVAILPIFSILLLIVSKSIYALIGVIIIYLFSMLIWESIIVEAFNVIDKNKRYNYIVN